MTPQRPSWTAPLLAAALAWACGPQTPSAPETTPSAPRARGVVLISIDALRADALGPWGSARTTTPFLDRLASRAVLFDRAFSPIPSTLPAHLTMLTGLEPTEHGTFPPSDVLSAEIPTLPERLRAAGVRTFGHSEGGYVQGGYGFARGFESWSDTPYASDSDVERTFGRGLDDLAGVGPDERFFLFLHSYTVHDPYEAPAGWRGRFAAPGPPPGAFPPTGPELAAFNRGERRMAPGALDWYRARYDEGVAYLDSVLESLFARLDELGLAEDTAVILTADHGEEFLEHGRLAHTQAYPECLHVPLLVVLPGRPPGARVESVVGLVDLAPTVLELLGEPVPGGMSGRGLARLLGGHREVGEWRAWGQEEGTEVRTRTLFAPVAGQLHQLLRATPAAEPDGTWLGRRHVFDASGPALELRAIAFHRPRQVTLAEGERELARITVGTAWSSRRIELPAGAKHRLTLTADSCDVPSEVGAGEDGRCLAVKVAGIPLDRVELFDLGRDPYAQRDVSADRADLVRTLARELALYPETPVAESTTQELSDEQIRQLKALGYL